MNWNLAETNVTPSGKVSVTITPVAGSGPLFMTFMLYVRSLPTIAGFGEVVFVIEMSAWAAALAPVKGISSTIMANVRRHRSLILIVLPPV
jgi:hypothetical protein